MAEKAQREREFTGNGVHSLDATHRITLPSRWRTGAKEEFYAIPDPRNPALILMPSEELEKIREKAESTEMPEAKKRAFIRQLYSRASLCTMDKQGRMVLPAEICENLRFKEEVVIAGTSGSRIEVWRKKDWDRIMENEEMDFASMAESVGL